MAKNIDFMGAVYSDVPSVRLPQQGGGLVGFDDTTDATATAEDIAQGKTAYVNGQKVTGTGTGSTPVINPLSVTVNGTYTAPSGVDGYSPVTVNVSGGGGGSVEESDVNFYDYDGTCVASYTAADFANLTAMPANPSHTGLTAQGWNWSLSDAKTYVAKYGILDIGQMYVTDDGKTRLYCHFEEGRTSPYLGICPNGTVVIDWGDGSATDTVTGSSVTDVKNAQHVYASDGDYVITLTVTNGTFAFYGASDGTHLLKYSTAVGNNIGRIYRNALRKIECGNGVTFGNYALAKCPRLTTVTTPNNATFFSGSSRWFNSCNSLCAFVIPTSATFIGNYAFANCYLLSRVALPNTITAIGTYVFDYCYVLKSISIPQSITTIGGNAFEYCNALAHVIIPDSVTNIDASAFYNSGLTSIRLSESLSIIKNAIFYTCGNLSQISIPDAVTEIGSSTFNTCYCISHITIPENVTTIGNTAFAACYGMYEYHFKPTTPPVLGGSGVFQNIAADCKIYVPYSADHSILEAYKTATNWSTQASKMVEEAP